MSGPFHGVSPFSSPKEVAISNLSKFGNLEIKRYLLNITQAARKLSRASVSLSPFIVAN